MDEHVTAPRLGARRRHRAGAGRRTSQPTTLEAVTSAHPVTSLGNGYRKGNRRGAAGQSGWILDAKKRSDRSAPAPPGSTIDGSGRYSIQQGGRARSRLADGN